MQTVWWYCFFDFLRVHWRKYQKTFRWLLVWLIAGIALGIVTVFVTDVGVDDINYHLIDGNILNATAINSSIGNFIWQRVLSIAAPIVIVLVFASLSRITSFAVFPVTMIHGYWLAVAIWWTFFYYSFTAILLLIFYIVWLIIVTVVILAGLLWALECGANLRSNNQSSQCGKQHYIGVLLRGAITFIGIAVVLGFFEYLVFWTVLGKIVYKPR